ncbi:hypothetical protein [Campylobacter canadensis]|uniref:hypothetical protein n=1 Tax=Campylobacter canadensis TaxID=449520 RepID=UPI001CCCDF4D|nr:hypothetical protein [Campylobacter canadensis]MBZ8002362.1 hypothetical protein [Campylobacter canadensis]
MKNKLFVILLIFFISNNAYAFVWDFWKCFVPAVGIPSGDYSDVENIFDKTFNISVNFAIAEQELRVSEKNFQALNEKQKEKTRNINAIFYLKSKSLNNLKEQNQIYDNKITKKCIYADSEINLINQLIIELELKTIKLKGQ